MRALLVFDVKSIASVVVVVIIIMTGSKSIIGTSTNSASVRRLMALLAIEPATVACIRFIGSTSTRACPAVPACHSLARDFASFARKRFPFSDATRALGNMARRLLKDTLLVGRYGFCQSSSNLGTLPFSTTKRGRIHIYICGGV